MHSCNIYISDMYFGQIKIIMKTLVSWYSVPSIAELASSPTIGHNLRVVFMQILIG